MPGASPVIVEIHCPVSCRFARRPVRKRTSGNPSPPFPWPLIGRHFPAFALRAGPALPISSGMKGLPTVTLCLALLAPSSALAQANAAAPTASDFSRLWTGWNSVNRDAMTIETEAVERVRRDVATADAERLRRLQSQGRALGERVGEIVRQGDCEEGERVAREAGDYALVEAVRSHCRAVQAVSVAPAR